MQSNAPEQPASNAAPASQEPGAAPKAKRAPVASNAAAHAMRLLQRARAGEQRSAEAKAPAGPRAAVIGGGISGLVAARELAMSGHSVTVYEASAEFGGCVRAHEVAGLVLDAGAESFATRSTAVADLLVELGLGDDIVTPAPGGAWLYLKRGSESAAQPLPATGILGIPGDPWAEEVRSAVGRAGALRAAADLITPVSKKLLEGELSLGALVRSRMGTAVLENLVTPVVSGVHSADPDTLDVDAVAPGLRAAVLKHGSLAKAVAAMRAAAPAGSAVASIAGGMNRLTAALLKDLRAANVVLLPGTAVASVHHQAGTGNPDQAFELRLAGGTEAGTEGGSQPAAAEPACFSRVVIATPGEIATDLLVGIDPGFAGYRPAPGAGISLVTLVIDKPELDDAPRGTGVLVAPTVDTVGAKALTHGTAKWQWLGDESGPGSHVLRLSYGRLNDVAGSLANADDASLRTAALADASTLLGLEITAGDVLGFDVVRYAGALPFATTGHAARVAAIRERTNATPGLEVVGAWLSGTGLAAVVADTRRRLRISAS
ncbi:protoporphyrinogen/coproporphyrinogen oxidase [Paeniglutamicibacter kerguelensis]|uniref:Oxygen-dependent protoporphyrinogen oxidase n=1 Tax=Paeniglutamicibacter kerguelensis TaxID=254788 RepID=A0ABS4XE33_9MICC|nr:FAD-dependent oxidoreductase [Paeniglutamicibacter kerguelensis]MBP2386736.1 oxygen-dependent protoporphyrinogen oxidase [Paeniglutamicibacter kerguelensis]